MKKVYLHKQAFTLLELLLVIAIVASLSGLILNALNPAERLQQVQEARSVSTANDLEKAIGAYILENGGSLPTAFSSLGSGYYDICNPSGSLADCINLAEIVSGSYISQIPVDSTFGTEDMSGFKLKYVADKSKIDINTNTEYREWQEEKGLTLTEDLVGYWKMDEASWNGTAGEVVDFSGNENHGTTYGGATITSNKFANGGTFDGSNDYIAIPHSSSLNSTKYTLSAWIKSTHTTGNGGMIFIKGAWGGDKTFQLSRVPSQQRMYFTFYSGSDTPCSIYFNFSLVDGNWHHMVLTFDQEQVLMYRDGVLATIGAGSSTCTAVPDISSTFMAIGANPSSVGSGSIDGPFTGSLDEARIYSRALSVTEVQALYTLGAPPVAYWKLDEGSGTSASDTISNNDASFAGGTATPVWSSPCKYYGCLYFDYDHMTITSTSDLSTNTFTIGFWFKSPPNQSNDWNHVFLKSPSSTGSAGWYINRYGSSNELSMRLDTSIAFNQYGRGRISDAYDGNWHYITYVVDHQNSNILAYKDGVLVATSSYSAGDGVGNNSVNLVIGGSSALRFANLYLDEIKIYNYARTQQQIIEDMYYL